MTRRPPRSPPFPNTTLSRPQRHPARGALQQPHPRQRLQRLKALRQGGLGDVQAQGGAPERSEVSGDDEAAQLDDVGDRKSTRLNSSHLVISYAVFCLKQITQ